MKTSAINYSRHIKHPPRERDRRVTCANEALTRKDTQRSRSRPEQDEETSGRPLSPVWPDTLLLLRPRAGHSTLSSENSPARLGKTPHDQGRRHLFTGGRAGGVLCKAATRGSFLSRRARRHTPGPADRRPPTSRVEVLPLVLVPVRGTSSAGDLKAACAS